jgi:hypothetical protein
MKVLVKELEQLTLELCGYVLVPGSVGGSSLCNPGIDSFQRNVLLKPIWQSTTERQGSGSSHNGIRVIMIIQSWAALLATKNGLPLRGTWSDPQLVACGQRQQ